MKNHLELIPISNMNFSWMCGNIDFYLIGLCIFENRPMGDEYLNCFQNELLGLLEDIPVNIREKMIF